MATTQTNKNNHANPSDPMLPRQFRITRFKQENQDTFSMEFEPVMERKPFSFEPGQFNMLYVFGVGEIPISISGNPDCPDAVVHTTRAVGNVTRAMRDLTVGDIIGIRGPLGSSWPVKKAEGNDIIIVTGGIGLAPLRPVIYHLLAHREKFGKVVLLHGTRTPSDLIYRSELRKWFTSFDMEVHITVDRATESWRGNVGVVTALIGKAPFDHLNCTAMVCGPEVMMRFTILELEKRGIDSKNIYMSMERNMKCGIGLCGHCQIGPLFVCKDGPVFCYDNFKNLFGKREL